MTCWPLTAVDVPALDVDGTLVQVRFGGAATNSTSSDDSSSRGGGAAAAYGALGVAAAVREVGPGRYCSPCHRHAFRTLVSSVELHPMTRRAMLLATSSTCISNPRFLS